MNLKLLVFLQIVIQESLGFQIYNSVIGNISYERIIETYKSNKPIEFRNGANSTRIKQIEFIFNECVNKRHDKGALRRCLCLKIFCIELYCKFPKVLLNNACVEPVTANQTILSDILTDPEILFFSLKFNRYRRIKSQKTFYANQTKHNTLHDYEIPVVAVTEKLSKVSLVELEFPCERNRISEDEIDAKETASYVVHSISAICLLILIIFFAITPELRANTIGKCWITYSVISFFGYFSTICLFIYRDLDPHIQDMYVISRRVSIMYSFIEFAVYFWLNIISFDTYKSLRVMRVAQPSDSATFRNYFIICTVFPLVIALLIYYELTDELILAVTVQRRYPDSSFGFYTKMYMEKLGLIEIVIKTLTLLFFLGTTMALVKHFKKVRGGDEAVNKKSTVVEKIILYLRMSILGGMIVGSLIFNYIIYFVSVFEQGSQFCDLNMIWVEKLNPIFELLKRLTGLYVLIYIFTGTQYLKILRKKFEKICKKNPKRNNNVSSPANSNL